MCKGVLEGRNCVCKGVLEGRGMEGWERRGE